MGALVGDALAVGPHWYYDLDELRRDYGDCITGYTDPKPHRYHAGLKGGQLSQAAIITTMLLRSVVDKGGYEEDDFCRRLDEELFPQLDGKPMSGPGGYTSQSIREAWRRRVEQKKSWKETGGHADITEAAERALVLAARYAKDPAKVAKTVRSNCLLTQADEAIGAMTTAYCCVLALLVSGEKLDPFLHGQAALDLREALKRIQSPSRQKKMLGRERGNWNSSAPVNGSTSIPKVKKSRNASTKSSAGTHRKRPPFFRKFPPSSLRKRNCSQG